VNGHSVVSVDHYEAVEVLKRSGYKLVLVVTREVPRLIPVTTKVYHSDFMASYGRAEHARVRACACVQISFCLSGWLCGCCVST
jgi:hypothetical protein